MQYYSTISKMSYSVRVFITCFSREFLPALCAFLLWYIHIFIYIIFICTRARQQVMWSVCHSRECVDSWLLCCIYTYIYMNNIYYNIIMHSAPHSIECAQAAGANISNVGPNRPHSSLHPRRTQAFLCAVCARVAKTNFSCLVIHTHIQSNVECALCADAARTSVWIGSARLSCRVVYNINATPLHSINTFHQVCVYRVGVCVLQSSESRDDLMTTRGVASSRTRLLYIRVARFATTCVIDDCL